MLTCDNTSKSHQQVCGAHQIQKTNMGWFLLLPWRQQKFYNTAQKAGNEKKFWTQIL